MICFACGRDIDRWKMALHRKVEQAISEGLAGSRGSATVDIDLEAMRQLEMFEPTR